MSGSGSSACRAQPSEGAARGFPGREVRSGVRARLRTAPYSLTDRVLLSCHSYCRGESPIREAAVNSNGQLPLSYDWSSALPDRTTRAAPAPSNCLSRVDLRATCIRHLYRPPCNSKLRRVRLANAPEQYGEVKAMSLNHTGIISGVLACSFALANGGCAVEEGEPTTGSTMQAVHRDSPAFTRLFGVRPHRLPAVAAELSSGQERLCQLQADIVGDGAGNGLDDTDPDDGGWDFTLDTDATEHSANPSPSNTYGATALALIVRGSATTAPTLGCAFDAALGMQARPEVDSPPDFVYWVLLGELTENPGFAELAAARYDAKVSEAGGAEALGESIRDQRHNAGDDGLIGYDLAWLTLAALALDTALPDADYAADAEQYASLIADDLTSDTPLFDINDGSEAFYTDGLSWSLVALDATRQEPQLQRTLKRVLRSTQLDNGAFSYNQDFLDPDLQATAGALLALEVAGNGRDRRARRAAIGYLVNQQAEDGGWDYAPGLESTLASADILFALGLTQEAPMPPESESAAMLARSSSAPRALAAPLD